MDRQKTLEFLEKNVNQKNIVKHMLATEAMMAGLYEKLKLEHELTETKEEWMMAGLMHDGDYTMGIPESEMGIKVSRMLEEEGFEISEAVKHCMAAHNWSNTGVEPKSLMDWSLFCGDSLTGLIVATALVQPEKKLAAVTVDSVLKKFKSKSFAAGTRREEIMLCQEKLGLSLEKFVSIVLISMQEISSELGL